uniref:Uncharacterized protein n=1 Tax=Meloidogyne enterolobii TaxID=390850 RepID=A0A6V7VK13_MELEN|nr:unnamed protein product [Meloidogyne enterolobii]
MFFVLLLLSIVVAVIYYVTLYPVDASMPAESEGGAAKEGSVAGSEESQAVSSGSRSDESAGGPFALRARRPGAPTPVPVYLVSPVEVRKLFGKGAATIDTEQSRGTSERSDAKASKGKKAKSNRRSGSKPAPASESDAGTAGKASKTKKRSGSSGRHRRKKEAGSSKKEAGSSKKEAGSASDSAGTEGN